MRARSALLAFTLLPFSAFFVTACGNGDDRMVVADASASDGAGGDASKGEGGSTDGGVSDAATTDSGPGDAAEAALGEETEDASGDATGDDGAGDGDATGDDGAGDGDATTAD